MAELTLLIRQNSTAVVHWSKVLPVPSMSLVASSVEDHLVAEFLNFRDISLVDTLDQVLCMGVILVDVLLVMLLVMDFKDLSNEDRLESIVAVVEFWQAERSVLLLHGL